MQDKSLNCAKNVAMAFLFLYPMVKISFHSRLVEILFFISHQKKIEFYLKQQKEKFIELTFKVKATRNTQNCIKILIYLKYMHNIKHRLKKTTNWKEAKECAKKMEKESAVLHIRPVNSSDYERPVETRYSESRREILIQQQSRPTLQCIEIQPTNFQP